MKGVETSEPIPMATERMTMDFQVHLARPSRQIVVRDGPPPAPLTRTPRGRMPRVTRMLVQAYLFQRMLENGQARDFADLARKFSLTRARVTRILNYTLLAPDIQAEILRFPLVEPGKDPLAQRRVRAVLREVLWDDQRRLWRELLTESRWSTTPPLP